MRPVIANISCSSLMHNYQILDKLAGDASIIAVVKANAYGHGLDLIAPALWQAGCRAFAVTDAEEGLRLRHILRHDDVKNTAEILVLSGIFDQEDAHITTREDLQPVLTHTAQVDALAHAGFQGRAWLKVNTGMYRLNAEEPEAMLQSCARAGISLQGMMSHLACADTPEHPLNQAQHQRFQSLCHQLLPEEQEASLLNSAGLIALTGDKHQRVRTGIALYGAEPVADQPAGLKPVMQLQGQVIQIH